MCVRKYHRLFNNSLKIGFEMYVDVTELEGRNDSTDVSKD